MVDHATAKYLSDNIGGVLAKAMAEMAVAQPTDGVGFLAGWLKTYVEQEEAKARRAEEEAKLQEARTKKWTELEAKAARRHAEEEAVAAREKHYQDLLNKFNDPATVFEDACWQELVAGAAKLMDAKAVYLGTLDEEGLDNIPGPLIRYEDTNADASMMLDKVLLQGQGVTWGAVTENPSEEVPFLWRPQMPPPVEADPADPDAVPAGPQLPPYLPVSIEFVTDVKEVHYFHMTRLGAYLAVPLVYSSYYSAEALAAAVQFEQDKKAYEEKLAELRETYTKAVEEAHASGGEEAAAAVEKPPELDNPEEKVLSLPGQKVKMVLCMDTLGLNTAFPESKIQLAMDLCAACAKCKEETEKRQVDAQAIGDIDEELRKHDEDEILAVQKHIDEEIQEGLHAEEAELAPDEERKKEVIHKRWTYLKAARVLLELQDNFLKLKSWVVVSQDMLTIVAATAFMFGFKKEQLYPRRKSTLKWPTLCNILTDDSFWLALRSADLSFDRKGLEPEQRLASIKAMIPEAFDAEKAKAISPWLEILYSLLMSAIDYRRTDLLYRKAEYEKQKEEEGDAFTLPPLEDIDDDFQGLE